VNAFPGPRKTTKIPAIKFTKADLSTPTKFGRKVLRQLNTVAHTTFKKSIQDVLVETPKSRIIHKPTGPNKHKEKRKWQKQSSHQIKALKEQESQSMQLPDPDQPVRKQKHGSKNLPLDTAAVERLLEEARAWSPSEKVNWSHLASKYGLTSPSKGQMVKEFMQEQGIPAALISQTPARAPRRSRKKIQGGRISIPMHCPLPLQRQKLLDQMASGEISIGEKAVKSTSLYTVQFGSSKPHYCREGQ